MAHPDLKDWRKHYCILEQSGAKRMDGALKPLAQDELTFTGKLGILLHAEAESRIPRLEPVLEDLDRLGFRLRSSNIQTIW